jgi:hypothetical protein
MKVACVSLSSNPKDCKVWLEDGTELQGIVSVTATAGRDRCTTATIEVVLLDGVVEIGRGGEEV